MHKTVVEVKTVRKLDLETALMDDSFLRGDSKGLRQIGDDEAARISAGLLELRRGIGYKPFASIDFSIDLRKFKSGHPAGTFSVLNNRIAEFNIGGLYGRLDLNNQTGRTIYAIRLEKHGKFTLVHDVPFLQLM